MCTAKKRLKTSGDRSIIAVFTTSESLSVMVMLEFYVTLRCDLDIVSCDPLTLNVCRVSAVMQSAK